MLAQKGTSKTSKKNTQKQHTAKKSKPSVFIKNQRVEDYLATHPIPHIRENNFLEVKDLELLLDKLLQEKDKIQLKKVTQQNFCLDKTELSDPLDEASVNTQASQELRFRNRDLFYLKKINKSLEKMIQGIYGLCQECDSQINYERLLARPTAEMCIYCKEEAEIGERNNIFGKRSKSLGQSLIEIGSR
jgi:DnaK suppressor protein